MTAIFAAILGALLAGGVQIVVGRCDRRREAEAVLMAICCEVDSICRLIRHRKYLDTVIEGIHHHDNEEIFGNLIADIRSDYFSVFNALSNQIGLLKPNQVALIVNFYAYCKSVIDSLRPDGPFANIEDKDAIVSSLEELKPLLEAILRLGDQILQLPRQRLHMETQ